MPRLGLNNNTISAKQEPSESPSRPLSSSPPQQQRYHMSPASSMHLDNSSNGEHPQHSPKDPHHEIEPTKDNIEHVQPQAEDLSNKSSRGASPAAASLNSHQQQNRYHPYCHSEIMIKSE